MIIPTPEQVKDREGRVRWNLVDPLLRVVESRRGVALLAELLHISHNYLRQRRIAIGMRELGYGRPPVLTLTPREQFVYTLRQQGKRVTVIAAEMQVTPEAVRSNLHRANAKLEIVKRTCKTCNGYGVHKCAGKCPGSSAHHHVCLNCEGTGWRNGPS